MDLADLIGLVNGWGSGMPIEAAPEPEPGPEPEEDGTEVEENGH